MRYGSIVCISLFVLICWWKSGETFSVVVCSLVKLWSLPSGIRLILALSLLYSDGRWCGVYDSNDSIPGTQLLR